MVQNEKMNLQEVRSIHFATFALNVHENLTETCWDQDRSKKTSKILFVSKFCYCTLQRVFYKFF